MSTSQLGDFGADAGGRSTGRVVKDARVGEEGFRIVTGVNISNGLRERIIEAVTDSLGNIGKFVERDETVAVITFDENGDPESLRVKYDPYDNPPSRIGEFEYIGDTTPPESLEPTIKQPGGSFDLNLLERVSYKGPATSDIQMVFPTRTESQRRDADDEDAMERIRQKFPSAVRGPRPGTWKRRPDDTLIHEMGTTKVIGLDPSEDADLYVDIIRAADATDEEWMVYVSVRTNDRQYQQGYGTTFDANILDFSEPPYTRTGAFATAFEVLAGNSPNDLFIEFATEIEDNPELADIEESNPGSVEDAVEQARAELDIPPRTERGMRPITRQSLDAYTLDVGLPRRNWLPLTRQYDIDAINERLAVEKEEVNDGEGGQMTFGDLEPQEDEPPSRQTQGTLEGTRAGQSERRNRTQEGTTNLKNFGQRRERMAEQDRFGDDEPNEATGFQRQSQSATGTAPDFDLDPLFDPNQQAFGSPNEQDVLDRLGDIDLGGRMSPEEIGTKLHRFANIVRVASGAGLATNGVVETANDVYVTLRDDLQSKLGVSMDDIDAMTDIYRRMVENADPDLARELHARIADATGVPDPFR